MANNASKILIIDDSETDALIMQESLKKTFMHNTIQTLNNASDAIDLLNKKGVFSEEKAPDLIILDLQMPDLNGFEFLKIVKKDPRFIHIPIIVLSGANKVEEATECYKLGANCFIKKPGDIAKFRQTVAVINDFWLGIAVLPQKEA